jgi:hypothetical protein
MKKPVMAIDMRRTATVLDFAIVAVSKRLCGVWLRRTYLSSPSCDLEWTMRAIRVSTLVVCTVSVRLAGVVRRISVLGWGATSNCSHDRMRTGLFRLRIFTITYFSKA